MKNILPFSRSIKVGAFIFVSGTIGTDPVTGAISKGDVAAQTLQALENIEAELRTYGAELGNAVKTTVFLTDMRNYPAMNEVYREKFNETLPARSCVAVAAVPHVDALVEIEMIVHAKE